MLTLRYVLQGSREDLVIPVPSDTPVRKSGLWEETCFELFLAVKDSPGYWEFNLSPVGHWNAYRFAAYRQGMREETVFTSLPFSVRSRDDFVSLTLAIDLGRIIQADQALEAGISAVIKYKDGDVAYWALIHCGSRADFHLRESFIVEL